MCVVLRGSKLGSLLFNINLIDFFTEWEDGNINSYAGDKTTSSCAEDTSSVVTVIQRIDQ